MIVAQAKPDNLWVSKIRGKLSVMAIVQFISLWQTIQTTPELTDEQDTFR
jgi:hypothetical protein